MSCCSLGESWDSSWDLGALSPALSSWHSPLLYLPQVKVSNTALGVAIVRGGWWGGAKSKLLVSTVLVCRSSSTAHH